MTPDEILNAAAERKEISEIVGNDNRPKDQLQVASEVFDHIFEAFKHRRPFAQNSQTYKDIGEDL